jgi:hypothetical protein
MGWVVNATPRPLYPWERPGTSCVGGWVGHRACLYGAEDLTPTRIRSPDRPACSEPLYRLSYNVMPVDIANPVMCTNYGLL